MFASISMTGTGVLVYLISFVLNYFGIDGIEQEQIAQFVVNCAQVVGFVLVVWGQLRRNDLSLGFWRK